MASKSNHKKPQKSPKSTKQPSEIEAEAPVEPVNREQGLTIVGIGASAGGLEALQTFFQAASSNTGMAFVVITHLHPEHESHMAEFLQKYTRMPTMQVTKRTKVEANHVYVIPPNRSILMTDTHLETREFDEPHGQRTPIDHFFRSLAASGHADPIAIILSGGGTDGEEYRSATEELETSKEELQSVNEELQTVNSEMKSKLDEISRAQHELENLMGATEIATLYLDRELRIQRYTAGVQELFNVLNTDRGRRISDLTHQLEYKEFVEDAEQVLHTLIPMEREIQRADGNWFLVLLQPFRTREDRIEGVVISFIEISQQKETERQLIEAKSTLEEHVAERTRELARATEQIRQARDMFFTLFHSNPIPTSLTQLEDGTFLNVNDAYLEFAGLQRQNVIGHTARELELPIAPEIRPRIINQLKNEGMVRNLELQIRRASGEIATVLASIQLISIDQSQALLLAFIDITDRVKAELQIRRLAYDLTMAEQEERRRISQILHDDLQQRIFAVKMQVTTLYDAYKQGNLQSATVDFAQLHDWLDESIAMTRNLSIDLSPAILQGDGLTDALVWLATQMEAQYGLKITLNTNGIVGRYEDTLRILLFQAVRELLFNIVKHANTLEANITLERVNRHTRITISDEGSGFDAQAVMYGSKSTGGLLNLQHRLSFIGCNLQINSHLNGKGTQAVIDIPLDREV